MIYCNISAQYEEKHLHTLHTQKKTKTKKKSRHRNVDHSNLKKSSFIVKNLKVFSLLLHFTTFTDTSRAFFLSLFHCLLFGLKLLLFHFAFFFRAAVTLVSPFLVSFPPVFSIISWMFKASPETHIAHSWLHTMAQTLTKSNHLPNLFQCCM